MGKRSRSRSPRDKKDKKVRKRSSSSDDSRDGRRSKKDSGKDSKTQPSARVGVETRGKNYIYFILKCLRFVETLLKFKIRIL